MRRKEEEGDVRPATLYSLLVLGKSLVQNMALSLDGETERLYEGGNETDSDADRNRDAAAARVDSHERERVVADRLSMMVGPDV